MWSYPDFVNQSVAANQLKDYEARGVMYGKVAYNVICLLRTCYLQKLSVRFVNRWKSQLSSHVQIQFRLFLQSSFDSAIRVLLVSQ